MTDRRTYVRMCDGSPDHPKLVQAGGLAGWMWYCSIAYASRHKTDGEIPIAMVPRLTDLDDPKQLACLLLEAKLWHPPVHDCPTCPQGAPGQYVIHDYLEHQRSAADIAALSVKRSAAGRNGGRASGESRRGSNDEPNLEASASANAKQVLEQTRSKNEADTDTSTSQNQPPSWSEPATPADEPNAARPDVEELCAHLVKLMVGDGCKPPTITKRWREEARRLFDLDGRALEEALAVLEWAKADHFWNANIQSIPKFRAKYDTLRLRREAEARRLPGAVQAAYQGFQDLSDESYQEDL